MGVAALLNLGIIHLLLRRWRKATSLHWTEQARILYPISTTAKTNLWFIPALITMACEILWPDRVYWGIDAIAAWIGNYLSNYPYEKSLFPQFTFRSWISSSILAWGLRFYFYGLLVLAGLIMPPDFGWITWIIFVLAFIHILLIAHGSVVVWFYCKTGSFKQPDERTLRIVTEAAKQSNTVFRHVWIFDSPISYGAAMIGTKDLLFSNSLVEYLSDDELSSICHHEFAHLGELLSVKIRRFSAYLSFLPLVLAIPMVHRYSMTGLALLLLPFLIIVWISNRLSRKMEVRADSIASSKQVSEGVYARALEKLYRNNHTPVVMSRKDLPHPHLYDRMINAGLTPDYPRPKPPKGTTWPQLFLIIIIMILFFVLASRQ